MIEFQHFVIPLSLAGRVDNVSHKTVRRLAERLRTEGEIQVQVTPTGRGLINMEGYQRLRAALLSLRPEEA